MVSIELGQTYSFDQIETYARKNHYEMTDYGKENLLGAHLIVIEEPTRRLSFVFNNYNTTYGNLYKLVVIS